MTEYKQYDINAKNKLMDLYNATGALQNKKRFEYVGALSNLRKLVGIEKAKIVKDIVEEYLIAGEKIILYAHHQDVIKMLEKTFKKYGVVSIHGKTPLKTLEENIELFQNNPKIQVMVLSTIAGGAGLNLTAACYGFFIERQWVQDDEAQAEDRMYRIGQNRPVTITYLHIPNTIDDMMQEVSVIKQKNTARVIDGKTSVIEYMINR